MFMFIFLKNAVPNQDSYSKFCEYILHEAGEIYRQFQDIVLLDTQLKKIKLEKKLGNIHAIRATPVINMSSCYLGLQKVPNDHSQGEGNLGMFLFFRRKIRSVFSFPIFTFLTLSF